MSYNAKNYTEQGGETSHIGGKLIIDEGGVVEGLPSIPLPVATTTSAGVVKVGSGLTINENGLLSVTDPGESFTPADNQADSTAETVADLVTDFNALLTKLKTAGLMIADSTTG